MTYASRTAPYDLFDNCSDVQWTGAGAPSSDSAEGTVFCNAITQLPIDSSGDTSDSGIIFNGQIIIIPGANCTGVVIRLREGQVVSPPSGAIDWEPLSPGQGGFPVVAGKVNVIPIAGIVEQTAYQVAGGGQYSVTMQCLNATTATEVLSGNISWWVLNCWEMNQA